MLCQEEFSRYVVILRYCHSYLIQGKCHAWIKRGNISHDRKRYGKTKSCREIVRKRDENKPGSTKKICGLIKIRLAVSFLNICLQQQYHVAEQDAKNANF